MARKVVVPVYATERLMPGVAVLHEGAWLDLDDKGVRKQVLDHFKAQAKDAGAVKVLPARMAGAISSSQDGITRATVSFRHSVSGTWPGARRAGGTSKLVWKASVASQ